MARIHIFTLALLTLGTIAFPNHAFSQTPPANAASATGATSIPRLIRYAGAVRDLNGSPLSGAVGVTFSLYAEQTGGAALWMETQNVQADAGGHYSILLGSAKPDGLPSELFASEQARWIGVQIEQQAEQPRALLVSAPYALKAGDAETLGGLPPSAFLRATSDASGSPIQTSIQTLSKTLANPAAPAAAKAGVVGQPQSAVTTSGGTAGTIPMFKTATDIENSILTQTGTVELNAAGTAAADSAPIIWLKNNAAIQKKSVGNAIDIRFSPDKSGTVTAPNAFIRAQENGGGKNGTSMQFATMSAGASGGSERVRITASGLMGIGTSSPNSWLEVDSQSIDLTGITAVGASADPGSLQNGSDGLSSFGGTGDDTDHDTGQAVGGNGVVATAGDADGFGGNGVVAKAGTGAALDGTGGIFTGGSGGGGGGDGIESFAGSGFAGYFDGDVLVVGTLSASSKNFKIDHPLDPADKYLVHASVESSEMMNIYTGNTTTNAQGEATVQLPTWFEALNTDFRYQLTVIGQFAQAIVARKIQNHEFTIKTSVPNVEVSWQVTGVRHDAFAMANPLVVEEEKEARLKGYFIHPALCGASPERQIEWARHARAMKQRKAMLQHGNQRPAVKR